MSYFKLLLLLIFIGVLCSCIPMGFAGLFFGFPAVLLNSLMVTYIIKTKYE